MKSFQKIPECSKCGSVEVTLKYETLTLLPSVLPSEYITCMCATCGYTWRMKTKDAGQVKAPMEIVE